VRWPPWSRAALVAALLVLSLGLASGLVACGGGGSADGDAPPAGAANRVSIDDAAGALAAHQASIRALAEDALARSAALVPLAGVNVSIRADAANAIGGWGLGGRTFSATRVEIYIDPAWPDLAARLPERLPGLVAHELHHAARWPNPGYGNTLLRAMVSEGMADHFAMQAVGAALPPWSNAFARDDTARLLDLARPEFDSTSYSHARWFFEAGAPQLPRWTGYTLGYRLVESYLAANPSSSAASLVGASAELFRPR
jgi:Predicted Zn-dependent protease (DUF2268)